MYIPVYKLLRNITASHSSGINNNAYNGNTFLIIVIKFQELFDIMILSDIKMSKIFL